MALTSTARWLIYAEVLVCFAPLAVTCLLGLLLLPTWIGMLSAGVKDPVHNPGAVAVSLWPVLAVITGLVGIFGIFRVCLLLSRNASRASNVLTLVAVSIGSCGLLLFALKAMLPAISVSWKEEIFSWPVLTYLILPLVCTAHLVFLVRKPLAIWRRNDGV